MYQVAIRFENNSTANTKRNLNPAARRISRKASRLLWKSENPNFKAALARRISLKTKSDHLPFDTKTKRELSYYLKLKVIFNKGFLDPNFQ